MTTTDTSTATRVRATRVRQTERIIEDLDDSWAVNPSNASSSGQRNRVRFADQEHLDSIPDGDIHANWQSGGSRDAQESCGD